MTAVSATGDDCTATAFDDDVLPGALPDHQDQVFRP
jgi:hypothetical protein